MKVLDSSMFEPLVDFLIKNGGPVITMFIKVSLLMTAISSVFWIARYLVLTAVSSHNDSDHPPM